MLFLKKKDWINLRPVDGQLKGVFIMPQDRNSPTMPNASTLQAGPTGPTSGEAEADLQDQLAAAIESATEVVKEKTIPEQFVESHKASREKLVARAEFHEAEAARMSKLASEDRLTIKALDASISILEGAASPDTSADSTSTFTAPGGGS